MKVSISTKLFLAVLTSVLLVIISMGVATNWSFGRGFVGYLNELALQRVTALVPRMAQAYRQEGSWAFMHNHPQRWFDLLRPDPPQSLEEHDLRIPPASDLTGTVFRTALLDADHHRVAGYPAIGADALLRPVEVDGRTVGYLAVSPFQSVTEAGGERFQQYQLRTSIAMGLVSLLLAMLIALWISRTLLDPVKRVAAATHRLAAGDYRSRVAVAAQDEVGQLATDFNHLAHTLERNEQLRREFMADVSHELRTPLSILRGELEAIEDGVRTLDQGSVKSLQGEVAMLSKLVDDLYQLSLADVGALAYRKQPCDLGELLAMCAGSFHERYAERGLRLELSSPGVTMPVQADAARLQQLINNLLENTLRYTDAGGELRIAARADNGSWRLDFLDSAPGVEPAQLARLFERFYRAEGSRSRASGGAGLGLAISSSIAQAHGGSLAAAPSPLGGLWLTLRLPREA